MVDSRTGMRNMQDEAEVCCGDEKQRELKTNQPMKRLIREIVKSGRKPNEGAPKAKVGTT